MPRENSFTALILRKQALGEADEIITFFSQEEGKVRAVSKSSKLSTSKLQYALQPMFLIDAAVSGNSSLPKLIRASVKNAYPNLHAHPERVALWFVVAELLTKLLPDNEANEKLYSLTMSYLLFLDSAEDLGEQKLEAGLLKYKLGAMESVGMGVHEVRELVPGQLLLFSPSKGGFYYDSTGRGGADSVSVSDQLWLGYQSLVHSDWPNLPTDENWLEQLSKQISSFITYQLDREIKSERFI